MSRLKEVTDAFLSGQLLLPTEDPGYVAQVSHSWADCLGNEYYILGAVVVAVMLMGSLLQAVPRAVKSFFSTKQIMTVGMSMNLSHIRNVAAVAMLLPFCIGVDYFRIFRPAFMERVPAGFNVAVIFVCLVAFLMLRAMMRYIINPDNVNPDIFRIVFRFAYDFFIVQSLIFLLLIAVSSLFPDTVLIVRKVAMASLCIVYLVFLTRKLQILTNSCNLFAAFLYLCALEIVPAGAIAAVAILL